MVFRSDNCSHYLRALKLSISDKLYTANSDVCARFRWIRCQKWLKNSNRIMSVIAGVLFLAFVIAVVVVKTIQAQESAMLTASETLEVNKLDVLEISNQARYRIIKL